MYPSGNYSKISVKYDQDKIIFIDEYSHRGLDSTLLFTKDIEYESALIHKMQLKSFTNDWTWDLNFYHDNGKIVKQTSEGYGSTSNTSSITEFIYSGNLIDSISHVHSSIHTNGGDSGNHHIRYFYDEQGRVTYQKYILNQGLGSEALKITVFEYIGDKVISEIESVDGTLLNKTNYKYSINQDTINTVTYRWKDEKWELQDSITTIVNDLNAPILEMKSGGYTKKYFYSEVNTTSAINIPFADKVSFYPNPCSGILNIKNENNSNLRFFNVYKTDGQLIFSKDIRNLNQILLSLDNGLYYYSIDTDKRKYLGSLIFINQ